MPDDPIAAELKRLGYGQPTLAFGQPEEGATTEQSDPVGAELKRLGYGQPTLAFGQAKEEEAPAADDTTWIGQIYGSGVRGFTDTLAGLPETMSIWAYNMERKYPSFLGDTRGVTFEDWAKGKTGEGGLYRLGQGIRSIGEAITPTESERYKDSFLLTDIPSGIGTVAGFVVGSKGVTAPIKLAGGGATGLATRGATRATAAATARGMTAKGAERAGRLLGGKAAAAETAALSTVGVAAAGVAVETTSGWEEAYGTLLAKAQAEGRELTNAEYDQAWSHYQWGIVSGVSEVAGANRIALKLFKNIDKGTKGAWGSGLRKILKDTAAGAGEEALQETFQTAWMNYGAAEIAKHDENRELFEGVIRAGGAGGVIGGIFGGLVSGLNRKSRAHRRIMELTRREKDLRRGGNTATANEVRNQIDETMLELGADADAVAASRAKFEAMAEFQKKEDETAEEHRTRLITLFTKGYIENEDGTITIPMEGGWTMTTVEKATREQAAGMTKPETEKYTETEENAPLREKVELAQKKVAKLEEQKRKKLDKKEDVSEVEQEILEATTEFEKAEAALKETPMAEVERERYKPIPEAAFKVVSPEGNDFGTMGKVGAERFVKEQVYPIEEEMTEAEEAEEREKEDALEAEAFERDRPERDRRTKHGVTIGKKTLQKREREEEERHEAAGEREERQREDLDDLDRRKRRLGLSQQQEANWAGGEVVDLSTTDPEVHKRYEVLSYAEREEGMGLPAVGEGQVLLKDLDTREYTVHASKLVVGKEEGFSEEGLEAEPYVAPEGKAAPRIDPENEAQVVDALKRHGFMDEDGHLLRKVPPSKGNIIRLTDVLKQVQQLRRQREAFEVDLQIKDLLEQQAALATKEALTTIENLNSKADMKHRGGIELDLAIVNRFRLMNNELISAENARISAKLSKQHEARAAKLLKQHEARAEKLWESIQDKLTRQGERKYKKLIKWYRPWEYLHERVAFDPEKVDKPPKVDKPRAKRKKRLVQGKILPKEVKLLDTYLKSLFQRKPSKTAAKVEGGKVKIAEGRAKVLKGVANGITYTAYQLDSGRVIVRTGQTYDKYLAKSEAVSLVNAAHNVTFIVEHINGESFGNNATPLGKIAALKAIRDSKGKVRLTEVHTESFVRKQRGKVLSQARTLAHKSVELTTNRMQNITQLDDGTITHIKIAPHDVGQSAMPVNRVDISKEREEEDAADRAALEKDTAILRRSKQGESKVVTTDSKGVNAEDRKAAEAFRQELIDLVTAGGEFYGLSFAGVRITTTGSTSQVVKDKEHKSGDAVFVKASEPNVVYLNPKMLRTYYVVEDGRLKIKTGLELRKRLAKETDTVKIKEINKELRKLKGEQRSINSVAREELIHMLDLQAIQAMLKKQKKVGNIQGVRSYLRGIYNTLSVAQREAVITKYMKVSKTVVSEEVGSSGLPLHTSPREGGLSKEQIAMEALRLIRSGDGIFHETLETVKSNRLFFNYFKGVREWVHKTIGTTEGSYTDESGRRRNMPKGIAAHLQMTESYLGISRDNKGNEAIHSIAERYDSELTMKFYYVGEVAYPRTKEGYEQALAFAQRQIDKLPPEKQLNNKAANKVRKSDGEVVRAALVKEEEAYGMSHQADRERSYDFNFRAKMNELLVRASTIKLTGKDLERVQKMGMRDGYDLSRVENWGEYAVITASIEANIVWGLGSGDSMKPYRSYKNDYEEKAFIAKGFSEEQAREKATYSEFPGGTIDTSATDYYSYLFLKKVMAAFEPRWKVKGSTRTFPGTPNGEREAKRFAFERKLKALKKDNPDKPTLTRKERQEADKTVSIKEAIEHEGEGITGLSLVPKAETGQGTRRVSLRMEYATAFLKHYTARKRSAGKRATDIGYDEDGIFVQDQWDKDVAGLTESMYEDLRVNPNFQAEAVEELITYDNVIGSIMDSDEKINQAKFDSKEEAELYQKKGMPWITKPEITEEIEYEFGLDPEGQPYKPLILVKETAVSEDDLVFVKTEEYMVADVDQDKLHQQGKGQLFRTRNVYRKKETLKSDKAVKRGVELGVLVQGEPATTTKYIVSGGTIQRGVPKKLELTELESRVVRGIVNEDGGETGGARTMLEVAQEFEKELEANPKGFIAKMIEAGEIKRWSATVGGQEKIQLWHLEEINNKAMEKVRTINEGWGRVKADMIFAANLDESPDSAAHIVRTKEGSETTTGESPVVDYGERGKSKWWRPGDWSATDTLKNMGLESLATKIDNFYNTESEILGSVMQGRRVLQRGGVELVGTDEQGNKRGHGAATGEQASGAFFHTEAEALGHAKEQGWKEVKHIRIVKGYGKKGMRRAEAFANEYNALRESGRGEIAEYFLKNKAPKSAKDLIAWQKDTGIETGKMLRKHRVMVASDDGWKLIKDLKDKHFPRLFKQEVWEIIEQPSRNPEKYEKLLQAVIDYGTAKNREGAHRVLQSMMSNVSDVTEGAERNDFFANMERARGFRLPSEFYDTSMDAYNTFLRRFSTRMAQISAFGQGRGGKHKTAWDALIDSPDLGKKAKDYIGKVYKSVYRSYSKDDGVVAFLNRTGLPATAVTYLSGPLTALRNTTFALRANAEHFGGWATLGASFKGLVSIVKTNVNTLKTKGELGMDLASAQAESIGAMRSDFLEAKEYAFDEDVRVGWEQKYKKAATPIIKIALLMQRTTEQFNRSITATMAKQHLRTTRKLLDKEPEGTATAKHVALITRMGYSPAQVKRLFEKDEDGHWVDNSRAVRNFIRDMVNERQYGYNLRQHPVFMDAPSSRILLQFQKWGFQRTRDFARNVWRPFFKGTDVTMPDGTTKNVKDGTPITRSLFLTIAQGELYATILRGLFYDRERDEIVVPLSEKTDSMLGGLSDRLVFDVIYDGGLGIVTDYISLLNPTDTRPRKWKDFMSPPAFDLADDTLTMVKDIKHILTEETGLNAKKDAVLGAIERQVMRLPVTKAFGFPFVKHGGLMHNARRRFGVEDYAMRVQDAEKDVRLVRAAARKFARARGYEEDRVWSGGVPVHTEKRELYSQLNEALLGGDDARAGKIKDKLVAGKKGKERRAVLTAIKASVRGKQPILLEGRQPADKVRREFLRWVKTELPGYEERIIQVNKAYWQAARRAGVK